VDIYKLRLKDLTGLQLEVVVDRLEVNGELVVTIGDDQDADEAGAVSVRRLDLATETTLVDDAEAGLEVTGLGHGDEAATVGDVNDTVLLVDGTHHGMKYDGRRRVRDDAVPRGVHG